MSSTVQIIGGILGSMLVVACASSSSKKMDRVEMPVVVERELANGLKIKFVKDNSMPRIGLVMLLHSGANSEMSESVHGLNSFVTALIGEVTTTKDSKQVNDQFALSGAELSAQAGSEHTVFAAAGLSSARKELADIFSEVILKANFTEKSIYKMKQRHLAALKGLADSPERLVGQAMMTELFGNHVYGRPQLASRKNVAAFKRKDVIKHYLKYFRPNNATLMVTGRFDQQFEVYLTSLFAGWESRQDPDLASGQQQVSPEVVSNRIVFISKPDQVQAQIRIAHLGPSRNIQDFHALRAAANVLGGSGFQTQLMDRLRTQLGLVYGVYGQFNFFKDAGYFSIETQTQTQSAVKVVEEILQTYQQYIEMGPTEQRLQTTQAVMIGQFPRITEDVYVYGQRVLELENQGVDAQKYLKTFLAEVSKLSVSDVGAAARKYMRTQDGLVIVVLGSPSLEAGLKKLGMPVKTVSYKSYL